MPPPVVLVAAALSVRLSFPFARPSSASASFPFPSLPPPPNRHPACLCLRAVPSFPVPFRPLRDGAIRYIGTFAPKLHAAIRYICTFAPILVWGVSVHLYFSAHSGMGRSGTMDFRAQKIFFPPILGWGGTLLPKLYVSVEKRYAGFGNRFVPLE